MTHCSWSAVALWKGSNPAARHRWPQPLGPHLPSKGNLERPGWIENLRRPLSSRRAASCPPLGPGISRRVPRDSGRPRHSPTIRTSPPGSPGAGQPSPPSWKTPGRALRRLVRPSPGLSPSVSGPRPGRSAWSMSERVAPAAVPWRQRSDRGGVAGRAGFAGGCRRGHRPDRPPCRRPSVRRTTAPPRAGPPPRRFRPPGEGRRDNDLARRWTDRSTVSEGQFIMVVRGKGRCSRSSIRPGGGTPRPLADRPRAGGRRARTGRVLLRRIPPPCEHVVDSASTFR